MIRPERVSGKVRGAEANAVRDDRVGALMSEATRVTPEWCRR
jgi:hypothetical protein